MTALAERQLIDGDLFKGCMRQLASTVMVVTATHGGNDQGMVATSVMSLTDEPPSLVVCINRTARTFAAVSESKLVGVSALKVGQDSLVGLFSGKSTDKFDSDQVFRHETGVPLVADSLFSLVCSVDQTASFSTHGVYMCTIRSVHLGSGQPLLWHDGRLASLGL